MTIVKVRGGCCKIQTGRLKTREELELGLVLRCVLKDFIRRYSDVFTDMPEETNVILHRVKLTGDTPAHCKPVDSMLEMLVVRALTSPYASPIVMVKKKDGSNRVCADFRKLNKITKVDPEPTTTAEICSVDSVARNNLFKIYLTTLYW